MPLSYAPCFGAAVVRAHHASCEDLC